VLGTAVFVIGYYRLVLVLSVGTLNNGKSIEFQCSVDCLPMRLLFPEENVTPSDVYSYAFMCFTIFRDNKMTLNCVSGFESSFSIKTFFSLLTLRIC
jgi:hypothetical protein